jgi:hypothetical protein
MKRPHVSHIPVNFPIFLHGSLIFPESTKKRHVPWLRECKESLPRRERGDEVVDGKNDFWW